MKILFVLSNYVESRDITDSYVTDLALSLSKYCNISIQIAFPTDKDATYNIGDIKIFEFRTKKTPINILNFGYFFQYSRSLNTFLRTRASEYDIVHIQGISSYLFDSIMFALRKNRTKIVVHTRGFGSLIFHFGKILLLNFVWSREVSAVICENHQTKCIINSYFFNKLFIIPGLFRQEKYKHSAESLSTNVSTVYRFAYLGRITKKKGVMILLKAFKKLREKYPNTELHFYGYGDGVGKVQKQRTNAVFYGGRYHPDNVGELLNSVDCFVYPTLSDSYPIGVLEAMYFCKPIITFPTPGTIEIQKKIGGMRMSTKDLLLTSMQIQLEQKENINYKNIREKMLKECDSKIISEKVYNLYKSLT